MKVSRGKKCRQFVFCVSACFAMKDGIVKSRSHTIHGTGVFTYIWLFFMVHVGKDAPFVPWMLWGVW